MAVIHHDIPDDLHRKAKSTADLNGQTLGDFLIEALEQANKAADTRKGR